MSTRKYLGFAAALLVLIAGLQLEGQAQAKKKITKPDLENWTEEQLQQWEDSVINALYPQPAIGYTQAPADTVSGEGKTENLPLDDAPVLAPEAPPIIYDVTIDQSKGVGEIPISAGTSPSGGVTYQVPIDVYPGPKGSQPQLALTYNSQGTNGPLGVGWTLSGLSKITRINRSIYYDGASAGINMTCDDAFTLDGIRLIKLSTTTTAIRYESEQGQIKAIAYISGGVISYFDVLYPNGKKAVYGFTTNTSSQYLEYPLTKISDLQRNTINYAYGGSNHYYIVSISYGDNAGASVSFEYDYTRPDAFYTYSGGTQVYENRRLTKINCKYGSTVLHAYSLSYITAKNVSVISQIDYFAGGNSFNPLKFTYGTDNTQTAYTKSDVQLLAWFVAGSSPDLIRISKGKFDYGSDDDGMISLPNKNPYWNHYKHKTWFSHSENRYDNLYGSNDTIFLYAGLSGTFADAMPNLVTEAGFVDIFSANVDGKYEEEVVKVNNKVNGSYDQLSFKVYTPNLYTGLGLKYTRTYNFSTLVADASGNKSIHPKFYFTGDFNGNGKMEVLAVSCQNPIGNTSITSKCYLFDLESNTKLFESYVFPYVYDFMGTRQTDKVASENNTDKLFVMDYDGDGKSDICLINDSGTNIYTFDVSGSTYTMRKVATYTGLKKADLANKNMMPGEFDGDGLIDLVVSPVSGTSTSWHIYHSLGNGMFSLRTFTGPTHSTADNYGELLQDVNGDGLTDLIRYTTSGFYTYLTKNGQPSSLSEVYSSKTSYSKLIPTSIVSENAFSQLLCLKDGIVTKYVFPRDDSRERMLSTATSSLGLEYRNSYQKLNSGTYNSSGPLYTKGYGAVFPYENFEGPIWMLSSQEAWLLGQRREFVSYNYQNAVIHKQGLGFRGFGRISSYDYIRNRSAYTDIDPYNGMVPKSDESDAVKNTYTYSISVQSNKIAKIRLSSKTTNDKLTGLTVGNTYTYDTYGNILTQTSSYSGGITVTTTNAYLNSTSDASYQLGYLRDQTVTTTRNGSSWSVRDYVVTSTGTFLPTLTYTYAGGNKTGQKAYTYDSLGKVLTVKETRFSSAELTTSYTYDAYGHLVTETDPMGFSSETHYAANGLPDYTKNHRGQQTSYEYDAFGRLSKTTDPLNRVSQTTYSWEAAPGTAALYAIGQTATGKPAQKTWFDALGREVRQGGQRFNGTWAYTDQQFDNYGRLQKLSMPFTGSSASYWGSYSYDSYDRPLSITQASGKITSFAYAGLKTTTTEEGIATARTTDALGKLVRVDDPGGTINYTLRPDGQVASIEAPGSVVTSISYDQYGRQTTLIDPSAGTTSYAYDTAGNLNQQTDAEGRVTNMVFDTYGRITSKSCPELSTSYVYRTEDGLLKSLTSNNGTATAYTYDTYGRLLTERETGVDGLWLEKAYTYQADGNPGTLTYTNHDGTITAEHYSYGNGQLTEIKLNGTTSIFKLTAENVLGQPTGVVTGTVTRQYAYNAYGIPTYRGANGFQSTTYNFDTATGNLLSRTDNTRVKTESFGYDQLNRLTSYGTNTASYDDKGNLTGKTDVGTLYYTDTSRPYALSGASLATGAVPLRTQQVSYSSFEQPLTITENGYQANFSYNANGQRVKMELKQNNALRLVRYYLGGQYEKDIAVVGGNKEKLYLGGDAYSAPAVYVKQASGAWQLYYLCRDYLGSITHVANSSGSLIQELSYDAWGRLRDPATYTAYAPGAEPDLFLGRGYTGHEHLTWFGLVNMNGRLYDPAVSRFLSPDNYVQLPDFSQNLNRYSYCVNNPLKYTDENGELFGIDDLIAAFVGGVINLTINAIQGNVTSWGTAGAYFATGAVAALATYYAGPYAGAAVLGAGNNLTAQVSQNGWGNIDWWQVGSATAMGVATSYLGGQLNNLVSPVISNLTSGIASPVIQQAVTQSVTNAASGFALGTGMSLANGSDWKTALNDGGKGALYGAGLGLMNGAVSGLKMARDRGVDPWSGEKLHGHHSDPIFMGGDKNQNLTNMKASTHRQLHKDMNDFLYGQQDANGNHMRPQSNNSGLNIQSNFTRPQLVNSLKLFYDNNKWTYPRARYDFYNNNGLKFRIW
ncbi:MAG: RHS repeat-associated core domain-containing protein [Mangrovibacterium sp.]